jgi:MFS family permease
MVLSQGFLGYALTLAMEPIVAEIFRRAALQLDFRHHHVALIGGGAAGPWLAGVIHDFTGSYWLAFVLAIAACIVSAAAIWIAAPRKVRRVPAARVGRANARRMRSIRFVAAVAHAKSRSRGGPMMRAAYLAAVYLARSPRASI